MKYKASGSRTVYDTMILGAGASGLYSAVFASRKGSVLILEKTESIGKKLSMTGNGRCNFTHVSVSSADYETDAPDRLRTALERYSVDHVLQDFQRFGICPVLWNDGYYPGSMDAKSVVRLLQNQLTESRFPVTIRTGEQVREIRKTGGLFQVRTERGSYRSRRVIFAMGGKSYPKTGSNGDGYYYLSKLGHTIVPPEPMLVPLQVAGYDKSLFGIRQRGRFSLVIDGKKQESVEEGELQFTKTGLSGIAVFQLSGPAVTALQNGQSVQVLCDFFPGSEEELAAFLQTVLQNAPGNLPLSEVLIGILQPGLMRYILRILGLEKRTGNTVHPEKLKKLCHTIKALSFPISGTEGFERAQTTKGGVLLSEIRPDTMESEICPGLYFSGEIVNVNGRCGGYNLQWAWTSGYLAGNSGT